MQLRTKTLVGEYDHVMHADEAWDQEAEGFEEAYKRAYELGDFSQVPKKDGRTPTVFRLQHLTTEQYRYIQDLGGQWQFMLAAVALALKGVSGATDESGSALVIKRKANPKYCNWLAVAPEQMEFLGADDTLVVSIGMRVIAARLPPKG